MGREGKSEERKEEKREEERKKIREMISELDRSVHIMFVDFVMVLLSPSWNNKRKGR